MNKIGRRKFLTNGAGLISIGAVTFFSGRFYFTSTEDIIENVIRYYFDSEVLGASTVQEFSSDYSKVTAKNWRVRSAMVTGLYTLPTLRENLSNDLKASLELYDRRVVTDFLLSTDFSGELLPGKKLEYFGLSDYRVCNPFARLL